MTQSCLDKQSKLKEIFTPFKDPTAKYQKIIELGKELPALNAMDQTPANRVPGCQSQMYLVSTYSDGRMHFRATSDALISKGLAALLLMIYNHESPETVLTCPPTILKDLDIPALLSPSRANGLQSLYLKMKQEALKSINK